MSLLQFPQQLSDEVLHLFRTAISNNDWDMFDSLLAKDDINIGHLSPIMNDAIDRDDSSTVAKLLDRGMVLKSPFGFVLRAIITGSTDTLSLFLQSGWDINWVANSTEPGLIMYVLLYSI